VVLLVLVDGERGVRATSIDAEGTPRPDWTSLLLDRRRDLRPLAWDEWERGRPDGLDWRGWVETADHALGPGVVAAAAVRLRR
jgi:hypothetical protein